MDNPFEQVFEQPYPGHTRTITKCGDFSRGIYACDYKLGNIYPGIHMLRLGLDIQPPYPHTGYMSNNNQSTINYYTLMPTTEVGAVCYPCSEYKGMVDCTLCGGTFCLFCADWCEDCGATVVYS